MQAQASVGLCHSCVGLVIVQCEHSGHARRSAHHPKTLSSSALPCKLAHTHAHRRMPLVLTIQEHVLVNSPPGGGSYPGLIVIFFCSLPCRSYSTTDAYSVWLELKTHITTFISDSHCHSEVTRQILTQLSLDRQSVAATVVIQHHSETSMSSTAYCQTLHMLGCLPTEVPFHWVPSHWESSH